MSIKTFTDFKSNFSLKDGEIGNQETLNRPLDRLKREIDLISNFLKSSLGMPLSDWNFNSFYEMESIVHFDGALYMSIADNNTGNNPSTEPTKWMVLPNMASTNWDIKLNYSAGDFVKFTDGLLYTSKQNNNIGFSPGNRPDYWDELSTRFKYLTATHNMLIKGNSQLDGNLAVGTLGTAGNRSLSIITNSDYTSKLSLYGQNNGSGQMFVGRDLFNGGGLEYYGTSLFDDTVPTAGADYLTLYRKFGGDWSWTARNKYTNDDWEFAGSMDINQNLNVDGEVILLGDAVGGGLTTVRHNFRVNGDATFDGDLYAPNANFSYNLGVFGEATVDGLTYLKSTLTVDGNVTLNLGLTNWTRIKGHTYAEGNMDVTGSTLARGHFGTEQGVTLNTVGGTTLINGATTVDATLKVNETFTTENNTVLNNVGGVTLIKGGTTLQSDTVFQSRAYFDDGTANAAVFRGTSAQNTGLEFLTDGTSEWMLYRSTNRDLIISPRNYNNAGATKTSMLVNWDTGIVDFAEQTYFQKVGGAAPFKVDSNVKVTNLNSDLLDGLTSSQFLRSDIADTVSGALTFTAYPTISGTGPTLKLNDTDVGADDFWIHANSNNFYVLADRDDNNASDGAHPLQLEADTNRSYTFGNEIVDMGNTPIRRSDTNPGSYGSLYIDGSGAGGWEGLNIGGRAVLMHDNVSTFGMYDDVNNKWLMRGIFAGATYLYHNGAIKVTTTAGGTDVAGTLNSTSCRASADMRAPLYYDSNNTAYYGDFAGTSYLAYLGRRAHHTGHLVGSYNSVGANSAKSNPIYTIGSSYNPNDADIRNMYGIGYSHTDATFIGTQAGTGWGMYVAADGDARIFLNGSNGIAYLTATSAYYADVAENYLADKVYAPGTVMGIGGENEITEFKPGMPLAGVVSTDPALQMNNGEEQAENELYIPVALVGKIPCFVEGNVTKGQYLIAGTDGKGYGVDDYDFAQSKVLIGVALEDSVNNSVMVKV